jgi:hypothetical protein
VAPTISGPFPVSEDGLLGDEPCLADTPHASMALDSQGYWTQGLSRHGQ